MAIAVERGGERFTAREGDRLQAGDRLGFFYSASKPGYLAFFNLDASGKASVLFPSGAQKSGRIEAGQERPLVDGGVVRGGDPCEWLVAFFSGAGRSRGTVLACSVGLARSLPVFALAPASADPPAVAGGTWQPVMWLASPLSAPWQAWRLVPVQSALL